MADGGAQVAGFLPSTRAFGYTNAFPKEPVFVLGPPGRPGRAAPPGRAGRPLVRVGDASRGLCGGMTYAVRDLFAAQRLPPAASEPPPAGSPWFRYLVRRLIGSWDLPRGAWRYYRLQLTPDRDRRWPVGTVRGTGHITAIDEWPRVRLDLDQGVLSPLGLITVRSVSPFQLGHNHQVLAYAYEQTGTVVTLSVYDPNTPQPDADDVRLVFDVARPHLGVPITHNVRVGDRPIRTFFRTRYRQRTPPP